jgi:hypothetical protein
VSRRFCGLVAFPFMLALGMLLAPPAWADPYTDQVVEKFNAQTHVVADPAASPPLQNPDDLNQQILTTRWTWSPKPAVWVAAVAPNQTGITTADAIHNVILGRDPEFSGVILVIDSHGYHVRAYNVPRAVADRVDPLMAHSARDHHNDPYGATSEFVRNLADVADVPAAPHVPPATSSPVANPQHHSSSGMWVLFIIGGIAAAGVGLLWYSVSRNRKRRKDEVKQELIAAEAQANDLDNAVMTNSAADVSAESLKANASLNQARKAYEKRDYAAAQAHLRVLQSAVTTANRKLYPHGDAPTSVPDEDRRQAEVRTKNPDTGQPVTINNNNYSTTSQAGYPHYYGGGYYNGVFFYPGFYPYAFWGPGWGWSPGDVLLMDALLDDHWGGGYGGGGYERGFEAGQDSAAGNVNYDGGNYDNQQNYDSQQGDVGFDGSYQSSGDSGFGGGDVGFGGNDFSGGYDSGGGGSDFGGSDFGGSDSGGGDYGF